MYEDLDFRDLHEIKQLKTYSAEQISTLRQKDDTIAETTERLEEFDHAKDRTPAGYAFYMRVKKKREPNQYQDGAPVEDQELSFFHATDEALVHSVLDKGLYASHAAHGVEGLWMFSLLTPWAFDWGWEPLQYFGGVVLHVKVPASACRTYTESGTTLLQQNRHIRGKSGTGHLRFVLHGKSMSSLLRCRIIGIYVRILPIATIRAGRRRQPRGYRCSE